MSEPTLDELIEVALAVSRAARPVPLQYFRTALDVEAKADASPVTRADRETETAMRAVLAERRPGDGILGEEHGRDGLDRRHVWVLDPIDGTKSFITGNPLFNSLVALIEDGRPVIGVIDTPAIGERYHGALGRGAWLGDRPLRTSGCTRLDEAAIYRAGHRPRDPHEAEGWAGFEGLGRIERFGYDAYAYALLAAGHVDVIVETDLEPYDFMAVVPVIEAAGGVVTDWSGAPLTLESHGDVAASASPALHEEVLRRLQS